MPKPTPYSLLNRVGLLHFAISVRDGAASVGRQLSDHTRLAMARLSSRSTDPTTRPVIAVGPDLARRPVQAQIRTEHRTSSAVRSNFELVTSFLQRASIDFSVSGDDVLVSPERRQRAVAAVAAAGSTVYVANDPTGPVAPARRLGEDPNVGHQLIAFEHHAASTGSSVYGVECGCRIEFSERTATSTSTAFEFPIDVVYTWVDGSDPTWRLRRDAVLETVGRNNSHQEATSEARFQSLDELRYSLRSLERYAEFVRHVYLVTDGQSPPWLQVEHPDVTLVPHSKILRSDVLPTFNSHAIEACLHHIPDLSEHYLYLNDDFLFARRATKCDYFDEDGRARSFPSTSRSPDGPVTASTRPVDAAAINVRSTVAAEFGVEVSNRKFKHAPYAQRRCVHREIERRFPELIGQTVAAQFRSNRDIAAASALHQHVAEITGFGVTGQLNSGYVDLGLPHLGERLRRLGNDPSIQVYCLNDSDQVDTAPDLKAALVREYLEDVLPGPSRFER